MKREKQYDRKNLKDRLSCIMMIYLDGLGPKKKNKMKKYLDGKVSVIVDHYLVLLKKNNLKMSVPPFSIEQIEKLCPETSQTSQTVFIPAADKDNLIKLTEKELIEQS